MNIFQYMEIKYHEREDKENIFPVGITDEEFIRFCIDYLLGEDWYVVDPLGRSQILENALSDILYKYSPRFRAEYKRHKKRVERKRKSE